MNLIAGLWCPNVMHGPHAFLRRSLSLPAQIEMAREHRTCVQAGGHIGIYPRILAGAFDYVHTFEPEAENFECLIRNTADYPNIAAKNCFLSSDSSRRNLLKHSKSSGGHQTGGAVSVDGLPAMAIDHMDLTDLDAIFLDTEGFEGNILKGALKTIKRCRPLLVLEENGKGGRYGYLVGELEAMMRPFGYRLVAREGEDIVLQYDSHARQDIR